MNLIQYELFASVARTLNISKSAQQYFISQPAASHHLKALEDDMGVELIKRTKHGVYLTEAGRELLPYVQEILALNNQAENRMRNIADGTLGRIRVAALSSTSNRISDCLVELYNQYPNVQVDISLLEGAGLIEAIRTDSYDFYFTASTMVPDNMNYERVFVERENVALFVNQKIADSIDMSDWSSIAKLPFVSVPKSDVSMDKRLMTICKNRGFEPRIINIYNRAEAVVLSVNAGLGVAILPAGLGKLYQRPNVVTFTIEGEDAEVETVCVWNPDKLSVIGSTFREILLERFQNLE